MRILWGNILTWFLILSLFGSCSYKALDGNTYFTNCTGGLFNSYCQVTNKPSFIELNSDNTSLKILASLLGLAVVVSVLGSSVEVSK